MPADSPESFLAAVRDANLLDPLQVDELARWAAQAGADTQAVVGEALRRGWLTPFQVKEVRFGRGRGLTLGPYVLSDLIGEGGMGRVYKARHARLGRQVALKVIRKEKVAKPVIVQRFRTEVHAAGQLSHPNVVLAFDADEVDGVLYYAMEFVEGVDLTRLVLERGPVPVPLACEYVKQAALGLQHASERGLVHRDVKPSNLLVTPRGQVKVLDLGLALLKQDAAPAAGRITEQGLVLGTPDFLAPEQVRDPFGVDSRADVYALGGTLYYLITGRVPYEVENPSDKLLMHVSAPPPSLLAQRPDAPPQLDAVIRWMMAKRPEDRPQTPAQAAMALAPFCPGAPPPRPAAPPFEPIILDEPIAEREPGRRPGHRRPSSGIGLVLAAAAGVVLLAVLIAAGVGFLVLDAFRPPPPPEKEFTNSVGERMVLLPGGSFVMGSPDTEPGRKPDEGPAGEVTVSGPFYVGTHEVTHGQFTAVMGQSPAVHPPRRRNPGATPVDSVTWDEAVEFCRRLTARERRRDGWAYRLPTEAEWEYACRAGTSTPFWCGDRLVLGKQAVFDIKADKEGLGEADPSRPTDKAPPYPVGSFEPSPWGLYDVHGNVWEWCGDYYAADYSGRAATDPTGPAKGDWRVARGGSWREPPARCRSAARRGLSPSGREDDVGFRVVFAPAK